MRALLKATLVMGLPAAVALIWWLRAQGPPAVALPSLTVEPCGEQCDPELYPVGDGREPYDPKVYLDHLRRGVPHP